jgi:plastocyanin
VNGFVLAEASINAYVIAGGILAVWAVLVALLGMRGFPSNRGGERVAIGITVILFVGAVGSAVADKTKVGERHGPEPEEQGGKPAEPSGSQPAPEQGGGTSGGGQQSKSGKPTALTLEADPSGATRFNKTALEASAGTVTITMTNPSPVAHNVALKGNGVNEQGATVQGDQRSVVKANVQAGQYEFYCSVPGHEQSGMKGTLTVK